METKIIIAGHGGQGIIFMGRLLAYAGMEEGKQVSCYPSYGPAIRGGTANCSVVVSTEEVACPVVSLPDILVAMNEPSLVKFEPEVAPQGKVFINRSLASCEPKRSDIEMFEVRATELASQLGNLRVANMVMLGVLVGKTGIVALSTVIQSLKPVLPRRRWELLELNEKTLRRGKELSDMI